MDWPGCCIMCGGALEPIRITSADRGFRVDGEFIFMPLSIWFEFGVRANGLTTLSSFFIMGAGAGGGGGGTTTVMVGSLASMRSLGTSDLSLK